MVNNTLISSVLTCLPAVDRILLPFLGGGARCCFQAVVRRPQGPFLTVLGQSDWTVQCLGLRMYVVLLGPVVLGVTSVTLGGAGRSLWYPSVAPSCASWTPCLWGEEALPYSTCISPSCCLQDTPPSHCPQALEPWEQGLVWPLGHQRREQNA